MIELKALRDDLDTVAEPLARRGIDRAELERVRDLDARRRELIAEGDRLRAEQNTAGRRIGQASSEDERQQLIAEAKQVSSRIEELEGELQQVQADIDAALARIPNLPEPQAPDGVDESDAVERRRFGGDAPVEYDFAVRDHVEIGEALGILDIERAAKVAGTRNAMLLGQGVLLEFALVRYAFDRLLPYGFTPVIPPVLLREEPLFGTGFLPGSADQIYEVPKDERYLAGTSEVPLAGMHADEIFDGDDLPVRYGGFSTCFRREAGAHGRDTRGLIRVHQFDKVEMFSFTTPDQSTAEHQRMLELEVEILTGLELHGRVVDIPVGDLGDSAARKYDCEVWLPSQRRYRELTSCSNCTDYQARRLRCRYRPEPETDTQFVHTLNGTACAVGRTIAALLETHQRADGSVGVPAALRPYLGAEEITPARSSR